MDESADSAVMIHVPGGSALVGKLARLDVDSLDCKIGATDEKLVEGRELRLRKLAGCPVCAWVHRGG